MMTMTRLFFPLLLAASTLAQADMAFEISDDGTLKQPRNYREWIYVGTPVTPNDMNDGKAPFPEFHAVYIDPKSFDHWKKTGKFRDGTILVKELVSVGSKQAVSGKGYFMGDFIGLEATIKSAKHFPNEPGNWAYFSFTDPQHGMLKPTANAFPTEACNACHQASAKTDWVFTQYYPVLRAADGTVGR
ncbi:MAG: cytochrome P460 family protein [Candidatus Thiodiazotropha endolucinida]